MTHDAFCLEWKNLEFTVPMKPEFEFSRFWRRRKTQYVNILQNVSGCLNTGEMVAILGPSGSGKTTFLASISQRMRGSYVKGSLYLNGNPITQKEITEISCFLPQFEIPIEALTCYEHLYFMCWFKMDRKSKKSEKDNKVKELLLQVGLKDKSSTMIAYLSGGEKKRLSLAEELINDPHFLFCDEPTTGLDSFSAFSVIKTLRELTQPWHKPVTQHLRDNMEMMPMTASSQDSMYNTFRLGRIRKGIVCSIHQPTSEIFELFTHIILISAGNVIFQGDVDDATLFFSRLGLACPRDCSPAEFYVKLVADEDPKYNFHDIIKKNYEQETRRVCKVRLFSDSSDYQNQQCQKIKTISCITQLYILLVRLSIQTRRKIWDSIQNLGYLMITSTILTALYSKVAQLDQSSVQDIQGSFFVFTTEIIFYFSYSVIYVFPDQLPSMRREVGENTISLLAFYLSQVLSFVPKAFICSFSFLGLIYSTIHYSKGIFMYLSMGLTLSLAAITATSYGFLVSSLFGSTKISIEAAPIFDSFLIVFGGMYLDLGSSTALKYFSLFYYANEALAYGYWHNVEAIECQQAEGFPCMSNGTAVLENYSFATDPYTPLYDYAGLGVLFMVMHFVAYLFTSRYVNKVGYY